MSNSLPTITTLEALLPALKIWQQKLNPTVASPPTPRSPFNFAVNGNGTGTTGITLTWEVVRGIGVDGYEIQATTNGDFSTSPTILVPASQNQTSYVYNTVSTGQKAWFRIRTTAGTVNQPASVKSVWTSPISQTSGSGSTTHDSTSSQTGLVSGGATNGGKTNWNPPKQYTPHLYV